MGDHEGTLQFEYDAINKKAKLILTHFGSTFGTLRSDEKSFVKLIWVLHPVGTINLLMQFILIARVFTLATKY